MYTNRDILINSHFSCAHNERLCMTLAKLITLMHVYRPKYTHSDQPEFQYDIELVLKWSVIAAEWECWCRFTVEYGRCVMEYILESRAVVMLVTCHHGL